ncbi:hypothetical protein GCM10022247_35490 [Allokutzneria multivorans]|uniref:2'-5' RNA ligase family protein n=1 Tax=Allokutzneria multivorans TaxID=1142134 RepID=A0ABP7SDR5_9PSEU
MTFPAQPPPSLDDPTVIQAHDWEAFRNAGHMQNHWSRAVWTVPRRTYHWMLSFHDAPHVRELAAKCQTKIDRLDFDLIPLDLIHLTIGRIAFTDEIDRATISRIAEAAQDSCASLPAFDLTVGPLTGSRGALRYSVAPWSPLLELHSRLSAVTSEQLGSVERLDTARFRPHISIAYSNATVTVADVLPLVNRLRAFGAASAKVTAASLVELRLDDRVYRYAEVARIPLVLVG